MLLKKKKRKISEGHAHLSLLQESSQGPLPPDSTAPKQNEDNQRHDDDDEEAADHAHRQHGVSRSTGTHSVSESVSEVVRHRHYSVSLHCHCKDPEPAPSSGVLPVGLKQETNRRIWTRTRAKNTPTQSEDVLTDCVGSSGSSPHSTAVQSEPHILDRDIWLFLRAPSVFETNLQKTSCRPPHSCAFCSNQSTPRQTSSLLAYS